MISVLIIDDDNLHNDLSILTFKIIGINDITCRNSGKEALAFLEECKDKGIFPDIMFVDLNMPGMDGFTFIRRYEESFMKESPGSRIIMLTNSILEDDRHEALKYRSVLDFWSKPLNQKKVAELITSFSVSYNR